MSELDLLGVVADVLAGSEHPVSIRDNRPSNWRPVPTDPIGMVCDSPPAYMVLVVVNWQSRSEGFPWVAVTHTKRFGFTPSTDGYTYLEPPDTVDRDDLGAVRAWLVPELLAAVELHAPFAAKARADDAGKAGPVEAWDAIREIR